MDVIGLSRFSSVWSWVRVLGVVVFSWVVACGRRVRIDCGRAVYELVYLVGSVSSWGVMGGGGSSLRSWFVGVGVLP